MLAYIGHQHHEDRDADTIRKCLGFIGYCVERQRRGKGGSARLLFNGALEGMDINMIGMNNNNSKINNSMGYQNGP